MALRPVFIPASSPEPWVKELSIEFQWYAGFSVQQKRKSIAALHSAARHKGIRAPLEISTKSEAILGRKLSAFNLTLESDTGQPVTVEAAFQGSKVFEQGGPFREFYRMAGRDIKADPRLRNSGRLMRFDWSGEGWPLEPKTVFYDWLYLSALMAHPDLAEQLPRFDGFTDIEFNPGKSINCQARSAALFVALHRAGRLPAALQDRQTYLAALSGENPNLPIQAPLF